MRLIDADAIIDFIDVGHYRNPLETCFSERDVVDMIESAPTVDAVEVVRCRDCRYCDPSNGIFWCDRFDSAVQIDGMAYCSYGKQKLKEDNQCSDT